MLYPLSYEGGGVFVQVTPYAHGFWSSGVSDSSPWRARSDGEQRFLELLLSGGCIRGARDREWAGREAWAGPLVAVVHPRTQASTWTRHSRARDMRCGKPRSLTTPLPPASTREPSARAAEAQASAAARTRWMKASVRRWRRSSRTAPTAETGDGSPHQGARTGRASADQVTQRCRTVRLQRHVLGGDASPRPTTGTVIFELAAGELR